MRRSSVRRPAGVPPSLYQYLIVEARGLCSLCHSNLIEEIHHIVPRSEGGASDYANLVGVCGVCHNKVHALGYGARRVRRAKADWVRHNTSVLSEIIRGRDSQRDQLLGVLGSFQALSNIAEFRGFRGRLRKLLRRGEVFKNFFRVRDHEIDVTIDEMGNAHVSERQRFVSFVRMPYRQFHLAGPPAPCSELEFSAAAYVRKKRIETQCGLTYDSSAYKSYEVSFQRPIAPGTPVEIRWSYSWPHGWHIPHDRYTYDVLAAAEQVEFTMTFLGAKYALIVAASFIDLFGREWGGFGHFERRRDGFRWVGTRLPIFSTVVLQCSARPKSRPGQLGIGRQPATS